MGEINRRKMEDRKEIIKIKEPISTANKFHSSELFYIEEAKLPFSAGIYTLTGCAMHWHHSWEILCQLEGEAYVRFGGEKIISRPGDITVISGEEPHETEKITKRHKIVVTVSNGTCFTLFFCGKGISTHSKYIIRSVSKSWTF